jgi:phage-related tail fiber protein
LDYATSEIKYKDNAGTLYTLNVTKLVGDMYDTVITDVLQATALGTVGIGKKPTDNTDLNISAGIHESIIPRFAITATASLQNNLCIVIKNASNVIVDVSPIPLLNKVGANADVYDVINGTVTRNVKTDYVDATRLVPTALINNTIYEIGRGHLATGLSVSDGVLITNFSNKDNTSFRGQVYIETTTGIVYYIWDKTTIPTFPKFISSTLPSPDIVRVNPFIPYIDKNYTIEIVKTRKVLSSGGATQTMFATSDTAVIKDILSIKELHSYDNANYVGATIDGTKKIITGLEIDSLYNIIISTTEVISPMPTVVYGIVMTDKPMLTFMQKTLKSITNMLMSADNSSKYAIPDSTVRRNEYGNMITNDTYHFKNELVKIRNVNGVIKFEKTNNPIRSDADLEANVVNAKYVNIDNPSYGALADAGLVTVSALTGVWSRGISYTNASARLGAYGMVGNANTAITAFYAGGANSYDKTSADSWLYADATGVYTQNKKIWSETNDGLGSGLDADLLRGKILTTVATVDTVVLRDSSGNITTALKILFSNDDALVYDDATNIMSITSDGVADSGKISKAVLADTATSANTSVKLTTARTITVSGDVSGSTTYDGSANSSLAITLATVATAGIYRSVTVNAKGLVTSGTNPTTLAGYGITDAVNTSDVVTVATANKILKLDGSAKLPASITGNADGNAATATKLTTARTITVSGDISGSTTYDGSANSTLALTLPNITTDGTYKSVTVNAKGLVTSGTNPTTIVGYGLTDAAQSITWTATVKGVTWSRILTMVGSPVIGHTFLLNISGTRSSVVFNTTFQVTTSHSTKCNIVQLNNNSYSTFSIRGDVDSDGNGVICIYDDASAATTAVTQSLTVTATLLRPTTITPIITFVDGTVQPVGTTIGESIRTVIGNTMVANLSGNASTATKLATARTITVSGDIAGSTTYDGSGNSTLALTLPNVATAGTYTSTTINAKGLVISGSNPTTLVGLGITETFVPTSDVVTVATANKILKLDANAKLPANITGNADGSATKLTTARTIALTGGVTGSVSFDGSGNVSLTATVTNDSHTHDSRYYTETESDARFLNVTEGTNVVTSYRVAEFESLNATHVGLIKITLPTSWTQTMLMIELDVYNFGATGYSKVLLGGLNATSSSAWVNTSAMIIGSMPSNRVRFAHDGTNVCILIGDITTSWNYPKVDIIKVEATHGTRTSFGSGWNITVITDETGLVVSGEPTVNGGLNAATATKLATARTITVSGDISGSTTYDGSGNSTLALTLPNILTAGTYKSVVVNAKGLVTSGTNPTTLAGYGIADAIINTDVVTVATANKILKLDSSAKLPASITGDANTVDGKHAVDLMSVSGVYGTGAVTTNLLMHTSAKGRAIYNGSWDISNYWGLGNISGQVKIGQTDINGNFVAGDLQLVLGSSNKVVATTDQIPTMLPANGGNSATVGGKLPSDFVLSDGNSEQVASVSVLKVQSTTSTERFEIDFNEATQSLDFNYYSA